MACTPIILIIPGPLLCLPAYMPEACLPVGQDLPQLPEEGRQRCTGAAVIPLAFAPEMVLLKSALLRPGPALSSARRQVASLNQPESPCDAMLVTTLLQIVHPGHGQE